MSDELKPCPFCGGEAERIDIPAEHDDIENASCIQCSRCDASTGLHFGRKENLESSWNDRTPAPLAAMGLSDALPSIVTAEEWAREAAADTTRLEAENARLTGQVDILTQALEVSENDIDASEVKLAALTAELAEAREALTQIASYGASESASSSRKIARAALKELDDAK